MSHHLRAATSFALLLVLAGAMPGCARHTAPTQPKTVAAQTPAPSSPEGALSLFRWCWEKRAITGYEPLFTSDYRFVFSQADSSGDAYPDRAATRDEDLLLTRRLFMGGEGSPEAPAQHVTLYFDAHPLVLPDSRPGKTAPWHVQVRTSVDLTVDLGSDVKRIIGYARFFVVRGDSAKLPPSLGLSPDSTRWYIERWEDETGSAAAPAMARASQPLPAHNSTWGQVKSLYR